MNLFKRTAAPTRPEPLAVTDPAVEARSAFAQVVPVDPDLAALTGEWFIDPAHSRVGFSVRHAMVTTVRGCFREYSSRLFFHGTKPTRSQAEIVINTGSVDTGVEQRDAHLVGRDFLDSANFPTMRFVSTSVEVADGDVYLMTGDLTIKDVTRPVTLELTYIGNVTDPFGYQRAGFDGTTTINRSDWGLTYDSRLAEGGAMVSEKVRLQFDIAAIRSAPTM
ncbi:YceI family protein [Streptomyces sp. NPDC002644]